MREPWKLAEGKEIFLRGTDCVAISMLVSGMAKIKWEKTIGVSIDPSFSEAVEC